MRIDVIDVAGRFVEVDFATMHPVQFVNRINIV